MTIDFTEQEILDLRTALLIASSAADRALKNGGDSGLDKVRWSYLKLAERLQNL